METSARGLRKWEGPIPAFEQVELVATSPLASYLITVDGQFSQSDLDRWCSYVDSLLRVVKDGPSVFEWDYDKMAIRVWEHIDMHTDMIGLIKSTFIRDRMNDLVLATIPVASSDRKLENVRILPVGYPGGEHVRFEFSSMELNGIFAEHWRFRDPKIKDVDRLTAEWLKEVYGGILPIKDNP